MKKGFALNDDTELELNLSPEFDETPHRRNPGFLASTANPQITIKSWPTWVILFESLFVISFCVDEHGAGLREAIASGVLPLDRIVLQTNSPYMMPNGKDLDAVSSKLLQHCYDGTNEPCTISIIVRCIARQLKQEPNAVAQVLFKTAVDVFKFPNISAHDH